MPLSGEVKWHFDQHKGALEAVWKIPDYRSASMQLTSPSFGSNSAHTSMTPSSSPEYVYNWHLAVHPHGSRRAYNGFVSLYLYNDDDLSAGSLSKPFVKITMKMIRTYENMASVYKQSHASKMYNVTTGGFGFHHFISRHYLLDEESCFIAPDETLSITVRIKHLVDIHDRQPDVLSLLVFSKNMSEYYNQMVSCPESCFTDVVFQIDGRSLHAHKFILSSRSPVFAAMFLSGMQESHSSLILVEDVDFRVMQAILRYIYVGDIDEDNVNNCEFVIKLFAAADKYNLKYLRNVCESYIACNLTPDVVATAMIAGHLHDSKVIKWESFKLISRLEEDVKQLEDWAEVHQIPGLIDEMICFWQKMKLITPCM